MADPGEGLGAGAGWCCWAPLFLDQNEPLPSFRAGDKYAENRHGNNHGNNRDLVHVILTEDIVDDDDDDDGDGEDDDDTEAMKET